MQKTKIRMIFSRVAKKFKTYNISQKEGMNQQRNAKKLFEREKDNGILHLINWPTRTTEVGNCLWKYKRGIQMFFELITRIFHWEKPIPVKHVCDLKNGSESHFFDLPPNANCKAKFKRRLQKMIFISAEHPFTHLYLRSKATITFEKHRHGISPNWWIIHPYSSFRFCWDIIMTSTFIYMFVMIPYMISFQRLSKQELNSFKNWNTLTLGFLICLIDICFHFITGVSSNGHEVFIDPLVIFKNYVRRYFFFDIISSVPFTWFYEVNFWNSRSNYYLYLLLEILPLLKLVRLCTVRLYIKEIVLACRASRVYEHGIWILLMTLLIFHWAACLTYAFPFFYAYVTKTPKDKAVGYLFRTKLYEKSDWIIYLTSLHIGGCNLCSCSFTELRFAKLPDKIIQCILLIYGVGYFLYVIVLILQLVSSSVEPELKYQSIICGIREYTNNKRLPKKLKERLLNYYKYRFQGSLFKEKTIISTLSNNLKYEIIRQSSSILLESTPLFNNISGSLLNSIIGVLKQEIFLQEDIIYTCDMEGNCMYFVVTGTIALITSNGIEICHVHDGDHFGEIALVQHEHKRRTTAIALEVCEVLRFDRKNLIRLIPSNSEFFNRLKLVANSRMKDIMHFESETPNDENNATDSKYNKPNDG